MRVSSCPASLFPHDGSAVDLLDKRLSSPFFVLRLPLVVEALISIPGCFFGMPAFHVAAPGLLALLSLENRSIIKPADTMPIIALFVLVTFWFYLNARPERIRSARILYTPPSLVLSPIVGLFMAHTLTRENANAKSASCFYLFGWYCSMVPVLGLKKFANRRRPVACDHVHLGSKIATYATTGKQLANITSMLRAHDTNASFPSGDVAGAVAFAYPLFASTSSMRWHIIVGVLCIALSAFGRMYFLAHHLLDVTVGGACAAAACLLCEFMVNGISAAKFWHPVAALAVLVIFAKTTRSDQAAPCNSPLAAATNSRAKSP